MLGLILLSISLSIDSLVIGMTYKMRKIRIPISAKLIIASVSAAVTFLAVEVGQLMCQLISERALGAIGAVIIIAMGIRVIITGGDEEDSVKYDMDRSEVIDAKEALLLGFVLSIDSMSVGIAAAMLGGQVYLLPIFVGAMNITFLWIGEKIMFSANRCTKLAGIILILVGLSRLLFS